MFSEKTVQVSQRWRTCLMLLHRSSGSGSYNRTAGWRSGRNSMSDGRQQRRSEGSRETGLFELVTGEVRMLLTGWMTPQSFSYWAGARVISVGGSIRRKNSHSTCCDVWKASQSTSASFLFQCIICSPSIVAMFVIGNFWSLFCGLALSGAL